MAEGGVNVGRGFVSIVPDLRGFTGPLLSGITAPLEKAGQQAGAKLKASLETNFANIKTAGAAAFAAVGIGAAKAIGGAVNETISWAGEVRKLSRELGLSAEDASRLAVAGDEVGVSVDSLSRGFGLFSKSIVNGSAHLDQYHVAIVRAKSGQVDMLATLGNVIGAFQALPAGADRAAFAQNVFGRSGKDLIPILNQGRAGLDELLKSADKYGLVLSGADVQAAFEAEKAQKQLNEAWKGAKVQLGSAFLPVIKVATQGLTEFVVVLDKIPGPIKAVAAGGVAVAGILTGLGLVVRIVRIGIGELTGAFVAKNAVETVSIGLDEAQAGASTAAAAALTSQAEAAGAGGAGGALAFLGGVAGPLAVVAMGALAAHTYTASKNTADYSHAVKAFTADIQSGKATRDQLAAWIESKDVPEIARPEFRAALDEATKGLGSVTSGADDAGSALTSAGVAVTSASNAIDALTVDTDRYRLAVERIPAKVATRAEFEHKAATGAVVSYMALLDSVNGRIVRTTVNTDYTYSGSGGGAGIGGHKPIGGQHGLDMTVTRPTLFMAGEQNTRERVSIQPTGHRGTAAGRGWSDESLERVADRIATAISKQRIQVAVAMTLDGYELQHTMAHAESRRTGGRR